MLPRWFRLLVVSTVGSTLFIVGLILLVLPGPGIPVLIAAFLVLGLEFAWAERFLHRLRHHATKLNPRRAPNRSATGPATDTLPERDPGADPPDALPDQGVERN